MKSEEIIVANLKCNGCATTINDALQKLKGVKSVEVDVGKDAINISYEAIERSVIIDTLRALGYPEATDKNGLLLQLKSYSSCMAGKIKNL